MITVAFLERHDAPNYRQLIHWGRVTQICVSKLTIIGSDNGLSPGWRHAIILINAEILLIEPWWKNQWSIYRNWDIFIQENAFENVLWKMAAILSRLQGVKLFVSSLPRKDKTKNEALHHWHLVKFIHQWAGDSSTKGGQSSGKLCHVIMSAVCLRCAFCYIISSSSSQYVISYLCIHKGYFLNIIKDFSIYISLFWCKTSTFPGCQ